MKSVVWCNWESWNPMLPLSVTSSGSSFSDAPVYYKIIDFTALLHLLVFCWSLLHTHTHTCAVLSEYVWYVHLITYHLVLVCLISVSSISLF